MYVHWVADRGMSDMEGTHHPPDHRPNRNLSLNDAEADEIIPKYLNA